MLIVLLQPDGGPFVFWHFPTSPLPYHIPIPDNAAGLALLNRTSWHWMSHEVSVLFSPLGMKTIPFATRAFKDFLFTSLLHAAILSRQNPESVQLTWEPGFLPEQSTQISHP